MFWARRRREWVKFIRPNVHEFYNWPLIDGMVKVIEAIHQ